MTTFPALLLSFCRPEPSLSWPLTSSSSNVVAVVEYDPSAEELRLRAGLPALLIPSLPERREATGTVSALPLSKLVELFLKELCRVEDADWLFNFFDRGAPADCGVCGRRSSCWVGGAESSVEVLMPSDGRPILESGLGG